MTTMLMELRPTSALGMDLEVASALQLNISGGPARCGSPCFGILTSCIPPLFLNVLR